MQYSTHLLRHLRFTIGHNIHIIHALFTPQAPKMSGVPALLLDRYEIGRNEKQLDDLLKIACVLEVEVRDFL